METTYVSSFFNFVGKIITRLIKRIMKRLGSFNWINFIHQRESIAKSDLSLKNSKLIGRKMNSYFSVPGLGWYRGSVGSRRLEEKAECAWIIVLLALHFFNICLPILFTPPSLGTITETGRVLSHENRNNNNTQSQKSKSATQEVKKKNKIICAMPWRKPCQEVVASVPGRIVIQ